ncbi:MAG: acyl-CoA ligase (AMP-forming), exosortase A system-associated [Motiliproteus sp.]|nr:acyl-CoA ligase (AMP-forming), exosortase A system-associated [Motiliproteus sp.]MCW9052566.1 acyl-CoA ligase (AMP-forming), exosortase A system-associated [Motiliproteus sp.]
MAYLLHHLVEQQAKIAPERNAVCYKSEFLSYSELSASVNEIAAGFSNLGVNRSERVAVYLPKQFETAITLLAASKAGNCFVPVNPVLKPQQVQHILLDCNVRVLVTNKARAKQLQPLISQCHDLQHLVIVDDDEPQQSDSSLNCISWQALQQKVNTNQSAHSMTDMDMAAILYTSGSTGKPKGVVLSHRNLVVGAQSVSQYLENTSEDRILALLPLSFDAGLSQLTTAFAAGACVYLMDYLLPNDVLKAIDRYKITGLTAVPPLWTQISGLKWNQEKAASIRYFANTGGHMPQALLDSLRSIFSDAKPFLMYGLTEAFRSTYLPPEDVDRKPGSMGKAIPNTEILVLREDGSLCTPHETGELVHRGPLVAQGYWNDPERTKQRFRPLRHAENGYPGQEFAVWSGDSVRFDEEGYLYFVGRQDEMIKTSGYRVSPSEVEEVAYSSGLVNDAVALGLPHPTLGQGILLVTSPSDTIDKDSLSKEILAKCRKELPNFMVPLQCILSEKLPRNPNGKIDRKALSNQHQNIFNQT